MTEARHDQAVALLTTSPPTIALLVEREAAPQEKDLSVGPCGPRPPSPPPLLPQGETLLEEAAACPLRSQLPEDTQSQYPTEVGEGGFWGCSGLPLSPGLGDTGGCSWPPVTVGNLRSVLAGGLPGQGWGAPWPQHRGRQ